MKLRKLIVFGFKSFADKTELEFDDGISCIVGPNGCGKSNIVDAVKWVLGEQSAKSLRGSEMMDVIFNGSATRRPAGGAEVTLVFDNSSGLLRPAGTEGQPCPTVAITRRLFRSGQSEYLINKSICRLRDVREMFMDTGNAYSLIEQGRIEGFLQASQDDRRAIFDEAAGISKYKARKKEALRKLERVDQNLLRVQDILTEVEKRLRSIKYQAGKARNYQTYSERLKELRSLFSLAQYHDLHGRRTAFQKRLDEGTDNLSRIGAKIDQLEAARSAAEVEAVDLERSVREAQSRSAAIGGEISTCQERSEMLAGRVEELGDQIVQASHRCEAVEAKIEEITAHLTEREGELNTIDALTGRLDERNEALRKEHHAGELGLTRLQADLEDEKAGTIDLLRRTAQLHNEIHGLDIRRENLQGRQGRLKGRAEEVDESLRAILTSRAETQAKRQDVDAVLADARQRLEANRRESETLHESEQALGAQLAEAREQRSALSSRTDALREMQQKLEGVSNAVRRVLAARQDGRLKAIRGMLGEFLQTDVEHAPLVEAALAGADQLLLTERLGDLQEASAEIDEILGDSGGLELLCLDRLGSFGQDFDARTCPQVIARVIDWVRFDAWLAPAMWRMLGRTLVVRTLDDAIVASRTIGGEFRFVTMAGQVLEVDGRVRLGAASRATGVISRRSELTELKSRCGQLDDRIAELQRQCTAARGQLAHLDEVQHKLRTAIYEANTERVECHSRLTQLDEQIGKLEGEKPLIASDMENIAAEIEASVSAEREAKKTAVELEQNGADRQERVETLTEQIAAAQRTQDDLGERITDVKVAIAQAQEKRRALQESLSGARRQQEQMQRDIEADRAEIELNRQRRTDAESGIASARDQIDLLYAEQTKLNVEIEEIEESRRGIVQRLEEIKSQLAGQRQLLEQAGAQVNTLRIELGEIDVRIENLITRAADEMGMDLLELFGAYEHDTSRDWQSVEGEIRALRAKIERLGNVNLDAIGEQEELEKRRDFLAKQVQDVRSSQNQLNDLIRRINKQSRELFLETFVAVRENFQSLFRKLFGGGKADILLSDPDDVLESGIEIVAKPPGKELRSLSLLSGGEKTMTALALLFSIFRAKPSPFCLLDEVDAALDEVNTERFSRLLQEFSGQSQFVIISHAKRTMSMANVLYGVTMQEPGVSKRISVRFEDAGHLLDSRIEPVGA